MDMWESSKHKNNMQYMAESLRRFVLGMKVNFGPFTTNIFWEESSVSLLNHEV